VAFLIVAAFDPLLILDSVDFDGFVARFVVDMVPLTLFAGADTFAAFLRTVRDPAVARSPPFLPEGAFAFARMITEPTAGTIVDFSPLDHLTRRSRPLTPVTIPSRGVWPNFGDNACTRSPISDTRTSFYGESAV